MRKIILITIILTLTTSINAQNIEWVKQGKAPKAEQGNDITYDNNGFIYITGTFQDSVRFDNNALLTASYGDYCAKYDTLGNVIWAKKDVGGGGIIFDGNANLYAFGKDKKVLQKLDLNGNTVWTKTLFTNSSFGSDGIQSVFTKGNDVYVTGYYSFDAYFDNDTIINAGGWDIFIAKFNSAGQNIWATTAGGTGLDKGYDIYVNGADELYAVGYYKDIANFGTTQLTSLGNADMYMAKYDANGGLIWVNSFGSTGLDLAAKIVVGANNDLYTTGRFDGSITFGATTLTSVFSDAFITKFDANGNALWSKGISGVGSDEEADIDYKDGELAFISTTSGDVTINGNTYTGMGALDICIGNMDSAGNILWAKIYGGTNLDEGAGVVLANGSTYFNGSFKNIVNFDAFPLTSLGNWDIVTGKINNSISTEILLSSKSNIQFNIYPNPTKERLILTSEDVMNRVELYNALGEKVMDIKLMNKQGQINLTHLIKGIYFVRIFYGEESTTTKIILE